MNWQVRNPLHCTTDGCTAKAEIEALRSQVAALTDECKTANSKIKRLNSGQLDVRGDWLAGKVELESLREKVAELTQELEGQYVVTDVQVFDDASSAVKIMELQNELAAMTKKLDSANNGLISYAEDIVAMTQERDTLNAALDAKITICGDASLAAAQARIKELREMVGRLRYGIPRPDIGLDIVEGPSATALEAADLIERLAKNQVPEGCVVVPRELKEGIVYQAGGGVTFSVLLGPHTAAGEVKP